MQLNFRLSLRPAIGYKHSVVALGAGVLLTACGAGLRHVPLGPNPRAAQQAVVVNIPPPPAQVESIPADPGSPCAWRDGQWVWLGQRWQWQVGAWVVPPPGCHYAEPTMNWVQSSAHSQLYYTPGGWQPTRAGQHCALARTCLAATLGTE